MQLIIGILSFLFIYFSFGIIRYYVTPPDIIREKIIHSLIVIQLIFSLAAAVTSYRYIDILYDIENSFEESNWKRIVFFVCLVFSFVFIIGFLFEGILILADKKYRAWRFQKEDNLMN